MNGTTPICECQQIQNEASCCEADCLQWFRIVFSEVSSGAVSCTKQSMLTSYITTYNRNPCSGYCLHRNDIRKGLIAGPGTLMQERNKTDAGHETETKMRIVAPEQLQPSRGITATSLEKKVFNAQNYSDCTNPW